MRIASYIIWRAEAKMKAKEMFPHYSKKQIEKYVDAVEKKIRTMYPDFFE